MDRVRLNGNGYSRPGGNGRGAANGSEVKQETATKDRPSINPGMFQKGWKGGPGNPFMGKVQIMRRELYAATTTQDLIKVWRSVIDCACNGDMKAAALFIERMCGKMPDIIMEQPVDERTKDLAYL